MNLLSFRRVDSFRLVVFSACVDGVVFVSVCVDGDGVFDCECRVDLLLSGRSVAVGG